MIHHLSESSGIGMWLLLNFSSFSDVKRERERLGLWGSTWPFLVLLFRRFDKCHNFHSDREIFYSAQPLRLSEPLNGSKWWKGTDLPEMRLPSRSPSRKWREHNFNNQPNNARDLGPMIFFPIQVVEEGRHENQIFVLVLCIVNPRLSHWHSKGFSEEKESNVNKGTLNWVEIGGFPGFVFSSKGIKLCFGEPSEKEHLLWWEWIIENTIGTGHWTWRSITLRLLESYFLNTAKYLDHILKFL